MMKKGQSKNFSKHMSNDNLAAFCGGDDQENGEKIMNGSGRARRSIISLIGIFKRRNFPLILFVGLSALVCALYYTSYYPGGGGGGTSWTLRFGITSFTNGKSRHNDGAPGGTLEKALPLFFDSAARNGVEKLNHHGHQVGFGNTVQAKTEGKFLSQVSVFDGGSGGNSNENDEGDRGYKKVVSTSEQKLRGDVGTKLIKNEAGEVKNENKIRSKPNILDWKYWASLNYWKMYLAGGNITADDETGVDEEVTPNNGKVDEFYGNHSEKFAGRTSSNTEKTTRENNSNKGKSSVKVRKSTRSSGHLSCNFPHLNPFDPSITEFLKSPPTIDCTSSYSLVFRTNFRNKLIQHAHPFPFSFSSSSVSSLPSVHSVEKENGKRYTRNENFVRDNYSCCYKTITRGNASDHNLIFSKRCYPIAQTETDIPADHEFISVRCKKGFPGNGKTGDGIKKPQATIREPFDINVTYGSNNGSESDTKYGITSGSIAIINSNKTKTYKDMFAFVPLKPLVEDRVRRYEESKRRILYENHARINQKRSLEKVSEREKGETSLQEEIKPKGTASFRKNNNIPGDNTENRKSPTLPDLDRLSIVVLGLDAQSHMNFIRQMPLTYNYLIHNLSAIGLYGYTKVGDNTFPNVVSLLSGLSVDELVSVCWPSKDTFFDDCPFIWKQFSQSGYRTSFAEDSVWMGTFNYEKKGFLQPPTDYYLHPLSLLMAKKIGHETWANAKLCYGPRFAFEVLLDYIVKTAVTFRNSLYFQFVWANSLFHDYLNNPRLGDEFLVMTLQFLKRNGFLDNTAFILLSDHGIRWGSIRSTYQGKIEERMPLAYFTFPDWFRKKYPLALRNLGRNAMRLTTPFDVHELLKDILRLSRGEKVRFARWPEEKEGDGSIVGRTSAKLESDKRPSSPKGISLFRLIPRQRTCAMAGIEEHWCVCHSMVDVPVNSSLVQSGADFIAQVINGLVSKYKDSCASLKLHKINEAKRKIDGDIDRGLEIDFLAPLTTASASAALREYADRRSKGHNKLYKNKKTDQLSQNGSTPGDGRVTSSSLTTSTSAIKKMIQLQIVIVTTPGNGVFEATIHGEAEKIKEKEENHQWTLSGEISRLNLYGEQSACVSDYTVQKYCYCSSLDNVD